MDDSEAGPDQKLSEVPVDFGKFSAKQLRRHRRAVERQQLGQSVRVHDAADEVQSQLGHQMSARQINALRHIEAERAKK